MDARGLSPRTTPNEPETYNWNLVCRYDNGFCTAANLTDYRMRPDPVSGYPGRTHRFYTGTPVFPFGAGLSYTSFERTLAWASTPGQFHSPPSPRPLALSHFHHARSQHSLTSPCTHCSHSVPPPIMMSPHPTVCLPLSHICPHAPTSHLHRHLLISTPCPTYED